MLVLQGSQPRNSINMTRLTAAIRFIAVIGTVSQVFVATMTGQHGVVLFHVCSVAREIP